MSTEKNILVHNLAFWLVSLAVIAVSIAVIVPWNPTLPTIDIDSNWSYGMNEAVARGLKIGKDIIFTFGPYASIYSTQYHPKTYSLMMAGSAYLSMAFAGSCIALGKNSGQRWVALIVLLLPLISTRDPIFLALPLIMILLVGRMLLPDGSKLKINLMSVEFFVVILVISAMGLLPIIKVSFALSTAISVAIACWMMYEKKPFMAILIPLLCLGSMISFWALSGQIVKDLPQYFLFSIPLVAGYTDSMSQQGNTAHAIYYLIAVFTLLYLCFSSPEYFTIRRVKVATLLAFSLTLFVSFKATFVRQGWHQWIGPEFLILLTYLLGFQLSFVRKLIAIGVVIFLWCVISYQTYPYLVFTKAIALYANTCTNTWDAVKRQSLNYSLLDQRFNFALHAIREDYPLPAISGTVDIYSHTQALVLAHGLDWHPRPIFQSYSAYEPELWQLNANHLAGMSAPENILFTVEPIDGRFAALEDGASWPLLYAHYSFLDLNNEYALFHRRKISNTIQPLASGSIVDGSYSLDQDIGIPNSSGDFLWAELNIQPTLLGRVVSFIFKLPRLHIVIQQKNGVEADFRYIADMGRGGFVLSPVVVSTKDFLAVGRFLKGEDMDDKTAKSLSIYGEFGTEWLWGRSFALKITPIKISSVAESVVNR